MSSYQTQADIPYGTAVSEYDLGVVDCHRESAVCAQNGVMSLPTLQVFFEGKCFVEAVRTFSLQGVLDKIQRPYQLIF